MLALPTPPPAQVVENESELRVSMPPRRHWFIVGFLLVWLCGWAAGEAGVLAMLISGRTAGAPTTDLLPKENRALPVDAVRQPFVTPDILPARLHDRRR